MGAQTAEARKEELQQKVQDGFIVEDREDMNEEYYQTLIQTLIIVGDTELVSVPPLITGYQDAPNLNRKIVALSIMQDEIGHAHIAYHLLEDLGVDTHELVFDREPEEFKHPYAMDFPLANWEELGAFNAFFDRAGYVLLGDAHEHTSYGPWKRALAKVDKEEHFHLKHGEAVMTQAQQDEKSEKRLERAVEWMFLMALEFFGVADEKKSRSAQLDYSLKGHSNDELRQQMLDSTAEFCESIGVDLPVSYNEEDERYELDSAFPARFDRETWEWDYDEADSWENVIERFKERGPNNEEFIHMLQKGQRQLEKLRQAGNGQNGH